MTILRAILGWLCCLIGWHHWVDDDGFDHWPFPITFGGSEAACLRPRCPKTKMSRDEKRQIIKAKLAAAKAIGSGEVSLVKTFDDGERDG